MHQAAVPAGDSRGVALALSCACAYGLAPALARLAYNAGAGVLTATTARFVAGVIGVGLLVWLGRRAARLPLRVQLAAGGLGLISTVTSLGYMGAIYFMPASLAVLIFYTYPVLVALGARWTEGEPLTWAKLTGLLVAFIGLAVALGVSFEDLDARGVALGIVAAIGAAVHVLVVAHAARWAGGATLPLNLRSMAVALVLNALLLAWAGGPVWPVGSAGWIGLVGTMLFFTAGVSLMYAAIARLGPVRASMILNLEPVVAIAAAVALLGERFGPEQGIGAALVLGAVLWVQLNRRR